MLITLYIRLDEIVLKSRVPFIFLSTSSLLHAFLVFLYVYHGTKRNLEFHGNFKSSSVFNLFLMHKT